MKKINNIIIAFASLGLLISCGSDDDGGAIQPNPNPEVQQIQPGVAELIFPLQDVVCTTGIFISETQSNVTFMWSETENTDSYDLVLTDLNDNSVQTFEALTNELPIDLLQNNPYSWTIISKSNESTLTGISPDWRFYNASQGVVNAAPYPAVLLSPINGATSAEIMAQLSWQGADPDNVDSFNDIVSYDLYLSENVDLNIVTASVSSTSFTTEALTPGTYFWRVETIDTVGNRTSSQVSSFNIQ